MTPAGKRKFACGFMFCLFPTMGMAEPSMRFAACVTAIRCCFKQTNAQQTVLRGFMDVITQQMLASKQISYQLSALDTLGLVVRLKVPGVAESILQEYIDLAIDFLHNTPSPIVKVSVLHFIEILLMAFPKGGNAKLEEIRDITRQMLVDVDMKVVATASRIYLIVFRAATPKQSDGFLEYLVNELDTLKNRDSIVALGDPLMKDLTVDQIERIFYSW